jgi:DNA mismatch repair protein MutL
MSDIIRLLPDAVANQIAAGEVVQRPASAVKELLENAIDAGSDCIRLNVKDAGRTLIQVIDNGKGMSAADARMSFERHATSKIQNANDLFNIRTKGFRGEALASIAAVAQVEMKTKRKEDSLGTLICIEGSEVKLNEPVSTSDGTIFNIKNLFFNVPARRNFLKSNPVELKHIIDEFQRVALAHPSIEMHLSHNEDVIFSLPKSNLRQRITGIFGKNYNEKLAPLEEKTEVVRVYGFIGKPENAKKTRGEQFFFVNDRFIKSPFLHHAVQSCYDGLIQKDFHASYFLFIEVDPKSIDVNIHPTKTEIKFEDERTVYAVLNSATRRAIGMFNLSPSLDFETEASLEITIPAKDKIITAPVIKVNPYYNPFESEKEGSKVYTKENKTTNFDWEKLIDQNTASTKNENEQHTFSFESDDMPSEKNMLLLKNRFIVSPVHSGIWIIDRYRASERILYETFLVHLSQLKGSSQQLLFPEQIQLNNADYSLLKEIENELCTIGFDISDLGNGTIGINGVPSDASEITPQIMIEQILEDYKNNSSGKSSDKNIRIASSLAKTISRREQHILNNKEMNLLVNNLFQCEAPNYTPSGKPVLITLTMDDLLKKFE